MQGLVTKSTGSWYQVQTPDGQRYDCRIKGKFRSKGLTTTNQVAVGDKVDFEFENGERPEAGLIPRVVLYKKHVDLREVLEPAHRGGIRSFLNTSAAKAVCSMKFSVQSMPL